MTIEQHIEELRAELRNCPDQAERCHIQAELEAALADLTRQIAKEPTPE
ncbi:MULTISPECIES: hypothetical protein [unclassified Ensifer]|nr:MULTISPECIES: hypothetical protein [unclassified Ensifer]